MSKYGFNMKYEITHQYLTTGTKRRSGDHMGKVLFLVAHDTGNPGSTALGNVGYYEDSNNVMSASAHLFVDDKHIVECIPTGLLGNQKEKAWHVIYDVPTDNHLFGDDANDVAIGVEYCYGSNINAAEAYRRYIWTLAYLCFKYNLDPAKKITGHFILDPARKTDPKSGLKNSLNITFEQCLKDIVKEYNDCLIDLEEEAMIEELKGQVAELQKQVKALQDKQAMEEVPTWAKAAVDKAVKKKYVDTPKGGSLDFYRILTVLDRAGKL